jgi:hypothetical protein
VAAERGTRQVFFAVPRPLFWLAVFALLFLPLVGRLWSWQQRLRLPWHFGLLTAHAGVATSSLLRDGWRARLTGMEARATPAASRDLIGWLARFWSPRARHVLGPAQ